MYQWVAQQVGGTVDSMTLSNQKFGAADRKERIAKNFSATQIERHAARIANCDVSFSGAKVKHRIGPDNLQRNFWMGLAPFWQSRHQPSAREGVGTCYSQPLLTDARRSGCDRTGERIETIPDHWKQSLADRRECNGPWTTTKERLTTNVLQEADLVADRGRRHTKFVGGLTEALVPRSSLKGPKRPQWRKLSHRKKTR